MTQQQIRTVIDNADIARREGRLHDADDLLRDAVTQSLNLDDTALFAESLRKLAQIKRDLEETSDAVFLYGEALTLYQQLDEGRWIAYCRRHLGDIQRETGDFIAAESNLLTALEHFREPEHFDPLTVANILRPLALLNDTLGRTDRATAFWSEALVCYSEAKVEAGIAECRAHLDSYSPSQ